MAPAGRPAGHGSQLEFVPGRCMGVAEQESRQDHADRDGANRPDLAEVEEHRLPPRVRTGPGKGTAGYRPASLRGRAAIRATAPSTMGGRPSGPVNRMAQVRT